MKFTTIVCAVAVTSLGLSSLSFAQDNDRRGQREDPARVPQPSVRGGQLPRGHEWVQVGADYVLIAIATGLIAHIVLNY